MIEFNQLAMANAEGSDDMLNRVMTKDNIGLAALLETKEGAYENGNAMIDIEFHQMYHISGIPDYFPIIMKNSC